MKNLLISVSLLSLTACQPAPDEESLREEALKPPPYILIEIDDCQYLKFPSTHGYENITHKGNCKNPIHCYVAAGQTK